jgi:magnesium transporter
MGGRESREISLDLGVLRAPDAAEVLAAVDPGERGKLLDSLSPERLGQVLVELDPQMQRETVSAIGDDRAAFVLATLPSDDRVEVLRSLSVDARERVLSRLEPGTRAFMLPLLAQSPDTAGGIMSLEVPTIRAAWTVKSARVELRENPPRSENTTTLFVLDEREILVGRVSLVRLLIEAEESRIESVMQRDVVAVSPDTDQEEAAALAARYGLPALPVVDDDRKLLGVVSFDDLFDVIDEEEAEDFAYFAGTGGEPPLEHSFTRAVRGRLPWLLLGLVGGIANVFVMESFAGELEKRVSVAFFVPAVLGLSGAVAIQSSSLVVRGLSKGFMRGRPIPRVASRELRVALVLGTFLGAVLAATAYVLSGGHSVLAWTLLTALIAVVPVAAMTGALIPLFLAQLGLDPAVAMGPFLTAVNDIVALALYLAIASTLLG